MLCGCGGGEEFNLDAMDNIPFVYCGRRVGHGDWWVVENNVHHVFEDRGDEKSNGMIETGCPISTTKATDQSSRTSTN